MRQPTIAIIGAGFSGSLLSLCLQSLTPASTRIWLIERAQSVGTGVAYGATDPCDLLNVPAANMGAFPDRPRDFLHWLQCRPAAELNGGVPGETAFVPRRLYGAYLAQLLDRGLHEPRAARLEVLHDEVIGIDECADRITLHLLSGDTLTADVAVLATGNAEPQPPHPQVPVLQAAGVWHADPWSPAAFAQLDADAPILLVGTGLTMVDAACTLLARGHRGPVHALSRHGLLPRPHATRPASALPMSRAIPTRLNALMRFVREEVERSTAAGYGWQPVIDSLRPLTQDLWRGMSLAERKRFLRHVRPWWDVHRHRVPSSVTDRIDQALAAGQLRIHAGHIAGAVHQGNWATIAFRHLRSGMLREVHVRRVVNCTGPGCDVTRSSDPLTFAMVQSGIARPDPLHRSLDSTAEGAVVKRSGIPSQRLFAIGPPTKAAWWEITAVPDIRRQCHGLAQTLRERLANGSSTAPSRVTGAAWGMVANRERLPVPA
jgi:uncharacterized NAD(P)/FAD-binding protein YdhS